MPHGFNAHSLMSKTRNETLCSKVHRSNGSPSVISLLNSNVQNIFAEKGFKFFSTKIMSSNFTQMAFGAFKETTLEEQYHEHEHEHEHRHEHEHGSHGHMNMNMNTNTNMNTNEHKHEHEYEHEHEHEHEYEYEHEQNLNTNMNEHKHEHKHEHEYEYEYEHEHEHEHATIRTNTRCVSETTGKTQTQ